MAVTLNRPLRERWVRSTAARSLATETPTRRVGYGVTVEREEQLMRKAIEPETFAALVETAAREFLTLYSNEQGN